MIKLYLADVSTWPDPLEHPEVLEGLSDARQQKIKQQKQLQKRKQSLGAGQLVAKMCAERGVSMNDICIGKHGKPEAEGVHFNLSHSGDYVICAVADKPIGCDIEQLKAAPRRVAERYFCEKELAYLQQFEGEQYDEAFVRLWTMKESYMKMTGEGMSIPLDSFEIVFSGGNIRVKRNGELQPCFIKEYEVPGYRVAVCGEEAEVVEALYV